MGNRCRKPRRAADLRHRKEITAIPAFNQRIRSKVTEWIAAKSARRPGAPVFARAGTQALQPRSAWDRFRPRAAVRPADGPRPARRTWPAAVLLVAAFLAAGCYELRTSLVQSYLLSLVAG